MKKFNVAFMGTPDFSVPTLELLLNHPNINLVKVISQPDRPVGRGLELKSPPVIEFCKNNKISFFQTENINKSEDIITELETLKLDFVVVLAFAQFLSQKVLDIPKLGCFNIHTSLLPRFRGAAPIQYALLKGDTSTGVSIQKMVKKMDAGDLVHSFPVAISKDEHAGLLYTKLKFQAALSMNQLIEDLKNNSVKYIPQNETDVTFAPEIKKEDGHLVFSEMTTNEIINRSRAYFPWPGVFCFMNKKRLKILAIEKSEHSINAGTAKIINKEFIVGTTDGAIRLKQIQPEGKSIITDTDFINGIKDSTIEIF